MHRGGIHEEDIIDRRGITPAPAKSFAQRVRHWVVIVIIASFSIAAIAGIIVLFGDFDAGPVFEVLASTALTGAFSVAVFCGAVLIGKPWQAFGWVTVAFATLTLGWCLWLVWGDPSWDDPTFEITATACTITAALSVSALLLLLAEHRIRALRVGLFVTLALIGVGVVMVLLPTWGLRLDDFEWYGRLMGIVWILAALGVVVLPVLTLALRNTHPVSTEATDIRLSLETIRRVETAARNAGISPDELIVRLLPPGSDAPAPQ